MGRQGQGVRSPEPHLWQFDVVCYASSANAGLFIHQQRAQLAPSGTLRRHVQASIHQSAAAASGPRVLLGLDVLEAGIDRQPQDLGHLPHRCPYPRRVAHEKLGKLLFPQARRYSSRSNLTHQPAHPGSRQTQPLPARAQRRRSAIPPAVDRSAKYLPMRAHIVSSLFPRRNIRQGQASSPRRPGHDLDGTYPFKGLSFPHLGGWSASSSAPTRIVTVGRLSNITGSGWRQSWAGRTI